MSEDRQRFLTLARERLLHELMSGWHRRGSGLLQMGLSLSPEFFWDAGFEVTALDSSPRRLEAARAQTGPKIDYRLSSPEHLPFDEGEFEYAVLAHQSPKAGKEGFLRPGESAEDVLLEARRVAAKGMIVLDWNRFSLAGGREAERAAREESAADAGDWAGRGSAEKAADFRGAGENVDLASQGSEKAGSGDDRNPRQAGPWGVLPWELYSLVRRRLPGCSVTMRSSLLLGESTWPGAGSSWSRRLRQVLEPCNAHPFPLPLGALLGMRVDWVYVPFTPVGMLREAAAMLRPQAAPMASGEARRIASD